MPERRSESENPKNSYLWFVPEIICLVICAVLAAVVYFFFDLEPTAAIERLVFSVIAVAIIGTAVRKQYPVVKYSEEDALTNLGRFWTIYIIGLCLTGVTLFIPSAAWPFTGFFVVLAVFSSPFLGLVGGCSLVMISALLCGSKAAIVILYILCGSLGIAVFFPIKGDIRIGRPMFITLLGLLACEMTGIILSSSRQLSPEQFLLPGVNVIITGIMIFIGIRTYALKVRYKLRDRYQLLNDTEYYLLAATRENDRRTYKILIHTSYFTERIAARLGMNSDALKCAGYYYKFCPLGVKERQEFLDGENFPEEVREILIDYTDFIAKRTHNKLATRESAVLLFSHTIIVAIIALYEKNPEIKMSTQIDKIVDATFMRYEKAGLFDSSNLTFNDVNTMKRIFKEEKLYYELLR